MAYDDLHPLPAQPTPPRFALSADLPHAVPGVDVVAVPVLPAERSADPGDPGDTGETATGLLLGPGAGELGDALGVDLVGVLEAERATGRAGEVTTVPVPAGVDGNEALRCVLLVGVGAQRPDDLRRAGAAVARAARGRTAVASSVAAVAPEDGLTAFVVGAVLGSFAFTFRSTPLERPPVPRIVLADSPGELAPVLARAEAVGLAGWRARQLATVPSNVKNPPWLAARAEELAREAGLEIAVWDEERLTAEGFGGILAVGRASATPPRLIRLDYTPSDAGRDTPTVAIVGKGITFDTGGLSIKPGESMTTMKRDMTGGAVVMATLAALREVGCPVRVVGLVAAAENAVGGDSMRPGDVIRHYGGRTSEVTNTDAEGRLVLGDGLAYAVEQVRPDVLVDVATLTGAMKVALGQQLGGLFANHDALADRVRAASLEAGEPLWRMPLAEAYEPKLSSTVADADNAPGGPGAVVAALFLQHFVAGLPWVHLDVASVGDSPTHAVEWTPGPTGFGARLLLAWLGSDNPLEGIA